MLFPCPRCVSRDRMGRKPKSRTDVIETQVKSKESYARKRWTTIILRARRCRACGAVFTTREGVSDGTVAPRAAPSHRVDGAKLQRPKRFRIRVDRYTAFGC